MSKFLSGFLSFLSTILVLGDGQALPRASLAIRELLENIPKALRPLPVLRGSRPIRPIRQAPFERVDRDFTPPVRFLDPSGEVFKKSAQVPISETYSAEEIRVNDHTIRIDLKRK